MTAVQNRTPRPAAQLPTRERLSRWANKNRKWLFAGPSMAFVALLLVIPLAWTLVLSLTDSRRSERRPFDFIGLENYFSALTDTERFWYVTVPLMRPVIIAAVLLRGIDALKTFDILYATKGKGGGAFHDVETLNVYAYGLSFDYNEYGLASAVLILFFLMILAIIWVIQMQRKATS
jgi:ABC-type sugar transport system permease subunit